MSLLSRLRGHKALRYVSFALTLATSILAAAIVATLTIDLGPRVREYAEQIGSKQLKRPIHINHLEIHLLRGRVVVDDFTIDGLKPTDRPFFTAKHLSVSLDWSRANGIRTIKLDTTERMATARHLYEQHGFVRVPGDAPRQGQSRLLYELRL